MAGARLQENIDAFGLVHLLQQINRDALQVIPERIAIYRSLPNQNAYNEVQQLINQHRATLQRLLNNSDFAGVRGLLLQALNNYNNLLGQLGAAPSAEENNEAARANAGQNAARNAARHSAGNAAPNAAANDAAEDEEDGDIEEQLRALGATNNDLADFLDPIMQTIIIDPVKVTVTDDQGVRHVRFYERENLQRALDGQPQYRPRRDPVSNAVLAPSEPLPAPEYHGLLRALRARLLARRNGVALPAEPVVVEPAVEPAAAPSVQRNDAAAREAARAELARRAQREATRSAAIEAARREVEENEQRVAALEAAQRAERATRQAVEREAAERTARRQAAARAELARVEEAREAAVRSAAEHAAARAAADAAMHDMQMQQAAARARAAREAEDARDARRYRHPDIRQLDEQIRILAESREAQRFAVFLADLRHLRQLLDNDIEDQLEKRKMTDTKINKSRAVAIARHTVEMLRVVNDPDLGPGTKERAVHHYKALCKRTRPGLSLLKCIAAVAVGALCFIAGVGIGIGIGMAAGAWAGPLAFFTGLIGAVAGGAVATMACSAFLGAGAALLTGFGLFKKKPIVKQADKAAKAALRELRPLSL